MTPLTTALLIFLILLAAVVTYFTAKIDKPETFFQKYRPMYGPTGAALLVYPAAASSPSTELFLLVLVTVQLFIYSATLFLLFRAKQQTK